MDLQMILGGSRAEFSRIFSYMMYMLYKRYAPLVSDIHVWKEHLPSFGDHMVKLDMPFDDTIGFLDGKVVETARPDGQGCVYFNFQDFEVCFTYFSNSCKIQGLGIPKLTVNVQLFCTLMLIYTVWGLYYHIQYYIPDNNSSGTCDTLACLGFLVSRRALWSCGYCFFCEIPRHCTFPTDPDQCAHASRTGCLYERQS